MNENFLNIPMEMRVLEQWVNIDADSKCPLNPMNGSAASSSDPDTWASFEEAVHRVDCGDTDNIGFVFDDNGIIGIDIDDGFDEDGLLSPTAVDILGKCHSYTERSRSGRGFHVILKGTLPFSGKNNKKGVEIYRVLKTARGGRVTRSFTYYILFSVQFGKAGIRPAAFKI